jgi:GNAT superfamily N-acetyltransferase
MEYNLELGDVPDEDVRKAIIAPLIDYNDSKAGASQGRPLLIAVRNSSNEVVGGFWGHTAYQWLFTQFLALPLGLRGRGIGSKLMRMAETEAVSRGCHGSWLDTFEFQARGFYESVGYQCFAELPEYPKDYSRFFMKKSLTTGSQ